MASRILPFRPSRLSRTLSPRSPFARPRPDAPEPAGTERENAVPGPRLAWSRPAPRPGASQASRVSWQVNQEVIAHVQGNIAQRHAGRQAFLAHQRGLLSRIPVQATSIGLRQRLFDALFFFAHPA